MNSPPRPETLNEYVAMERLAMRLYKQGHRLPWEQVSEGLRTEFRQKALRLMAEWKWEE